MKFVNIESPYSGNLFQRWLNRRYARRCLLDSLNRGEIPLASHLLYTQVLNDKDPVERDRGIVAGLQWNRFAEITIVYTDRGISPGMEIGINAAKMAGRLVEYRKLNDD